MVLRLLRCNFSIHMDHACPHWSLGTHCLYSRISIRVHYHGRLPTADCRLSNLTSTLCEGLRNTGLRLQYKYCNSENTSSPSSLRLGSVWQVDSPEFIEKTTNYENAFQRVPGDLKVSPMSYAVVGVTCASSIAWDHLGNFDHGRWP